VPTNLGRSTLQLVPRVLLLVTAWLADLPVSACASDSADPGPHSVSRLLAEM
jgi:hypothetical protein